MSLSKPKNIYIEGNIGVGKTTICKKIRKRFEDISTILLEPVDKWRKQCDSKGNNILDLFYKDPKKYSCLFQSKAFLDRVELLKHKTDKPLRFVERSVFTDRYCFAENCFDSGLMEEIEWNVYKEWFSWLVKDYNLEPDAIIYLRSDPRVNIQRIMLRGRTEEASITYNYLKQIHDKHDKMLGFNEKEMDLYGLSLIYKMDSPISEKKIPVLVLDCNKNFENESDVFENFTKQIQRIIDMIN